MQATITAVAALGRTIARAAVRRAHYRQYHAVAVQWLPRHARHPRTHCQWTSSTPSAPNMVGCGSWDGGVALGRLRDAAAQQSHVTALGAGGCLPVALSLHSPEHAALYWPMSHIGRSAQ